MTGNVSGMESHAQSGFTAGGAFIIRVYGIYDGEDSATAMQELLQHLAGSLGRDFHFATTFQRADLLRRTQFRAGLPADACDADMIFVALGPEGRLSIELVAWLEEWAENRRVADAALVALVTGPAGSFQAAEILRGLAERHRVTLLLSDDAVSKHAQVMAQQRRRESPAPFVAFDPEPIQYLDHWGINE